MKKSFLMLAAISVTFLAGCGEHKNPLINDKTIAYLKERIRLDYGEQEFMKKQKTDTTNCGAYYAEYSTGDQNKLKEKCEKWSKEEFKMLQQDPSTPYQATIENFRDPALWNIVTPKNGN